MRHARRPAPKPDNPEQSKRFVEMAKEVGADESDAGLEAAITRIARKQRPAALKKPTKKAGHP